MNGVLFMQIFVLILFVIFGGFSIWGMYQFIKPLDDKKKKECKNLN